MENSLRINHDDLIDDIFERTYSISDIRNTSKGTYLGIPAAIIGTRYIIERGIYLLSRINEDIENIQKLEREMP